eukprot:253789-Amphidinium_carterae.3
MGICTFKLGTLYTPAVYLWGDLPTSWPPACPPIVCVLGMVMFIVLIMFIAWGKEGDSEKYGMTTWDGLTE